MPGGGVALLYASRTLAGLREGMTSFDQQIGVDIVHNALKVPLKTIANNAGARPSCHTFAMHDPCPLCVVNAVETKTPCHYVYLCLANGHMHLFSFVT